MGWAAVGNLVFARLLHGRHPVFRFAIALVLGLGLCGFLTFFVGLIPNGFSWGQWLVAAMPMLAIAKDARHIKWQVPELRWVWPLLPVLFLGGIGVLAPSTTIDWDSLAYHFAVPKIWLGSGQIEFISFIHHSNFPFIVDNLYIWGLLWGGEVGAKAFSLIFALASVLAVYGVTTEHYGEKYAGLAAVAFATMPMVLWLSGTGYIDVSHGVFVGLAILMVANAFSPNAQASDILLASLMLGGAIASKYTGLQVAAVVALVFATNWFSSKSRPKVSPLAFIVPLLVAAPWYVRNVVNTGNPVYPFFYSALGGKNWSDYNAKIYSNEQQTFGAGREQTTAYTDGPLEVSRLPHAVLGLAYQPGRYTNPNPVAGAGFPFAALGAVGLVSAIIWLSGGRMRRYESVVLGCVGVSLLLWFFLSQQSRYIVGLTLPLCVLAGGAVSRVSGGKLLLGLIPLQAIAGISIHVLLITSSQLPPLVGSISEEEYRTQNIAFAEPARVINSEIRPRRIALYDEVFGFLLDVPYFWGNPGHTTEIGYESMQTSDDFVAGLEKMGISHVYLNLRLTPPDQQRAFLEAAGLSGPPVPFDATMRSNLMSDVQSRWKPLLAEAIGEGKLRLVREFGSRLVFEIVR
jgi:4-amino-4-deoxy-L-arabinose transferase-like glycosyltransferase